MNLQVHRASGGVVVALRGRFGAADVRCLEHVLRDLIEGQGNTSVALDATGLVVDGVDVDVVLAGVAAWADERGARVTIQAGAEAQG